MGTIETMKWQWMLLSENECCWVRMNVVEWEWMFLNCEIVDVEVYLVVVVLFRKSSLIAMRENEVIMNCWMIRIFNYIYYIVWWGQYYLVWSRDK
jgi:hypothetical protein